MRKKFKLIVSMLVALSLIMVILTGCGGSQDGTGETQRAQETLESADTLESTDSEKSEASGGDRIVVTMSMWDAINEEYNFVKAFNESQDEIELQIVAIPDSYSEKINAMIVSNTAPDIILAWECDILRFIEDGVVIPLDDYMQSSPLSEDELVPAVKSFTDMTGGAYGLPWCYAGECIFYNKDMFDVAKVPYPANDWTIEDFENAAESLTIVEGNEVVQYGLAEFEGANPWYSFIGSFGDEIVDSEGNLQLGDGTREALSFFKDLTDRNVMSKPTVASGSSGTADIFAAGKAAMRATGTWNASVYRDIDSFNWDIAPLPSAGQPYNSMHTGLFTITKNSKNPDAAWKVIDYLLGDEGQELIGKAYSNMSARVSVNEKGYFKAAGEKGPSNMDAYDTISSTVKIGYVLLNSGLANDVGQKFNAVMSGQLTIDECMEQSKQLSDELNS